MGRYRTKIERGDFAGDYEFRVPQQPDLWALRGSIPTIQTDHLADGTIAPEDALRFIEFSDRLLLRCQKTPRLVATAEKIEPGIVPVDELPWEERQRIALELMRLAGFSAEAADEVRPLSETATA